MLAAVRCWTVLCCLAAVRGVCLNPADALRPLSDAMFCLQVKRTCYAQSSQIRQIRRKMVEIMTREASSCDLKELVGKFIPEAIGENRRSTHNLPQLMQICSYDATRRQQEGLQAVAMCFAYKLFSCFSS